MFYIFILILSRFFFFSLMCPLSRRVAYASSYRYCWNFEINNALYRFFFLFFSGIPTLLNATFQAFSFITPQKMNQQRSKNVRRKGRSFIHCDWVTKGIAVRGWVKALRCSSQLLIQVWIVLCSYVILGVFGTFPVSDVYYLLFLFSTPNLLYHRTKIEYMIWHDQSGFYLQTFFFMVEYD